MQIDYISLTYVIIGLFITRLPSKYQNTLIRLQISLLQSNVNLGTKFHFSLQKYGECKEGHLHAIKSQFLNDVINIRNEPMSYMFYREYAQKDRVFVSDTLKISLFECPINIVYLNNPSDFPRSINCDNETASAQSLTFLEENLFSGVKKRQDELLNNFQTETEQMMKNLKAHFNVLHLELDKITERINDNKEEMIHLNEQIKKQEEKIKQLQPKPLMAVRPESHDHDGFDDPDLADEVRMIRNDPTKTFLNYLKPIGKHWEISQPAVFTVVINGMSVMAVYDPRVAKSIISQDIISSRDQVEDLKTEQVFLVPWRHRHFQSCYESSNVVVCIYSHKHHLNVSISPYWTRKVLLGLNFGVKFVDSVKEKASKIVLCDDLKNFHTINFEWFEKGSRENANESVCF